MQEPLDLRGESATTLLWLPLVRYDNVEGMSQKWVGNQTFASSLLKNLQIVGIYLDFQVPGSSFIRFCHVVVEFGRGIANSKLC